MAKRKITVTVDEELVDAARRLGVESLSSVVNSALAEHVDRAARRAALGALLDEWDAKFGPVDDETLAWAEDAFDELDQMMVPSGPLETTSPDSQSTTRPARGAA